MQADGLARPTYESVRGRLADYERVEVRVYVLGKGLERILEATQLTWNGERPTLHDVTCNNTSFSSMFLGGLCSST